MYGNQVKRGFVKAAVSRVTCNQAYFFPGKRRGSEREEKIRLIHLFCEPPSAPHYNKLNCLSTVKKKTEGHGMHVFQAFSYRIFPETSRNLSDEGLTHLHVNFIQRGPDAEPTRQLINVKVS